MPQQQQAGRRRSKSSSKHLEKTTAAVLSTQELKQRSFGVFMPRLLSRTKPSTVTYTPASIYTPTKSAQGRGDNNYDYILMLPGKSSTTI